MAKSLFAYSGITTKSKAMQKKILKQEDYIALAQLSSVRDFVLYLKTREGYQSYFDTVNENNIHRGEIESMLKTALYQSFESLYHFAESAQKKELGLIYDHYEIDMLNDCLKHLFSKRVQVNTDNFKQQFQKLITIPIDRLMEAQTTEEFFSLLRHTPYERILPLQELGESTNFFDASTKMFSYYYKSVWKKKDLVLDKSQNALFTRCIGTKIDVQNIMTIYRCKKYYQVEEAKIQEILIPIRYQLSKEELRELIGALSINEFVTALQKTRYAIHKEEITPEDMENNYGKQIGKAYTDSKCKAPLSMAPIYCYLYQKERELNQLTTILEGIRYKLGETKISQLIQG